MPDIYDEALADRKKLLEVAESNAKNKIISVITPQIKKLVENQLLGKLNEEFGDDDDIFGDFDVTSSDVDPAGLGITPPPGIDALQAHPVDQPDVVDVSPSLQDVSLSNVPGSSAQDSPSGENAGLTLPDQQGKITLDVDAFLAQSSNSAPGSVFELTPESLNALNALVGTPIVDLVNINERITKMHVNAERLVGVKNPSIKDREQARQIRVECERIYSDLEASRQKLDESKITDVEQRLENIFERIMARYSAAGHIIHVVKEMMNINRRAGKLNKQITESSRLTGLDVSTAAAMMEELKQLHNTVGSLYESLGRDDSVDHTTVSQVGANLATLYTEIRSMVTKKGKKINEADELDVGGADAAGVEDVADVDAEQVLVQLKLPSSLMDIASGSSVEVVSVEPASDDSADDLAGVDDMGGEDDLDMDDMNVDFGGDEDSVGDDEEELDLESYSAQLDDDDIIEIDEAVLVAEMRKMKKLREKKKVGGKNVNTGGHGPAHFDAFGGGKDEGEKFVDGEDLNAHDPLGSEGFLEEGEDSDEELDETDLMDESDDDVVETRTRSNKAGRSNRRSNEKQLAEAFTKVRAELAGQKLFNTKLVALNRVLQFPGLKRTQKEKVVDILDRGRTVAEVKQLYSRIVESLKKGQRSVNESAQAVPRGSASRATTSSSSSAVRDEQPMLERWNRIAFGNDGNKR